MNNMDKVDMQIILGIIMFVSLWLFWIWIKLKRTLFAQNRSNMSLNKKDLINGK